MVLLTGLGALLLVAPCTAAGGATAPLPAAEEAEALALLAVAAEAVQERSWSGTQYVSSWHGTAVSSAVLDVQHTPGSRTQVRPSSTTAAVPGPAVDLPPTADVQLLSLLAGHYLLAVGGRSTCAGRSAAVVEARRGDGQVAGRFWLDRASGLPLRREVYDAAGRLLHSSAYVDLAVAPGPLRAPHAVPTALPTGQQDTAPDAAGAPQELPGGFTRFEERAATGAQLRQVAYSDGLSTLSVFRQPGGLGPEDREGYLPQRVGEGTVWVHDGAPEQVVWTGAGEVFTVVSDAGPQATLLAISALPRDPEPDTGLRARLGRGLARVGSWVNPFG